MRACLWVHVLRNYPNFQLSIKVKIGSFPLQVIGGGWVGGLLCLLLFKGISFWHPSFMRGKAYWQALDFATCTPSLVRPWKQIDKFSWHLKFPWIKPVSGLCSPLCSPVFICSLTEYFIITCHIINTFTVRLYIAFPAFLSTISRRFPVRT